MGVWQPIETAPKDGSEFLAFQDGEYYRAKVFDHDTRRIAFRTHSLFTQSKHYIIDAEFEGKPVKARVPADEPWPEEFRHDWCFWTRGFEFKPTHWQPLPSPPGIA